MIELLRYLEANGFTNYIASGGDRDFMRPVTEEIYGIPSERVIGSSNALALHRRRARRHRLLRGGDGLLRRRAGQAGPDLEPDRASARSSPRGNSNGDIPMLRYAGGKDRPALRLLVLHDDDEREFAYTAGAETSLELAAAARLDGRQHQERLGDRVRRA